MSAPRAATERPTGAATGVAVDGGHALAGGTDLLKAIAGPLSLLTVVLYYFGWLRSNAIARYWGYTVDMIGLSNEDFLLRSVVALYRPIAVGVLALLVAHRLAELGRAWAVAHPARHARVEAAGVVLVGVGTVALVVAGTRLDGVEAELALRVWWRTGALLLVGAAALAAGLWARAAGRWMAAHAEVDRVAAPGRLVPLATTGILVAVALVGVFVLTTQFAARVGTGQALATQRELATRPAVTLYSTDDLHVAADGVVAQPLDGSPYRWRYENLRLLLQGDGHLLLVPGGYGRTSTRLFVVPLGEGVRLDIDRRPPPP